MLRSPILRLGIPVVAVAAVATGLVALRRNRVESLGSIPFATRPAEGRLSAAPEWKPYGARLDMNAAARLRAWETVSDSASDAPQQSALARLLLDQPRNAVETLERGLRQDGANASLWSDLAAARLACAVREDDAAELPLALVSADRAIAMDPTLAAALFNRAVVLERMHLRAAAAHAWRTYLRHDATSRWADEAQERAARLSPEPSPAEELARALERFQAGDEAALEHFVTAHPQLARTRGEGLLLTRWAAAQQSGDLTHATALLDAVRAIGRVLAARGEHLLEESVAAIDHSGEPTLLVLAYLAYRDGRSLLGGGNPRDGVIHLDEAARLFDEAHSPMADVARYFVANAKMDQSRLAEARVALEELERRVDHRRYPAFAAEIQWQLTRCDGFEGRWSACLLRAEDATRRFEGRGEKANAAFMKVHTAEALDRLGRPREAWRSRLAALEVLAHSGAAGQVATVLAGAVRGEMLRRQFGSALSLTAIALEENRRSGQKRIEVEALMNRAMVFLRMGEIARARTTLAAARHSAADVLDGEERARALADCDVVDGAMTRHDDPVKAVRLLSSAIDRYTRANDHMALIPALLERGRTWRDAGDDGQARMDLERALRELETQRASIHRDDLRSEFFDTEPSLFAELIELHLRARDVATAYEVVERSRARTLNEQLGAVHGIAAREPSLAEIRSALAPEEIGLAYHLLSDGFVVFTLDRSGIAATRVTIPIENLRAKVSALGRAVSNATVAEAELQRTSAALWQLLIAPVAKQTVGARRLLVMSDRFLNAVPFAALYDAQARRYLIEQHEIVFTPNGSFLHAVAAPHPRRTPALIIGNPERTDGREPLPRASAEARAIARLYGTTPMIGHAATRSAFLQRAPRSAVIHYAGHAERGSRDPAGQLLLSGHEVVDASEIARLRLHETSLVVIAGCGTLAGNAERIEGMPSLARAFLAAGVPSVVGTIWDIPDDTSTLIFPSFHAGIAAGLSPAAALREAQVKRIAAARGDRTWALVALTGHAGNP